MLINYLKFKNEEFRDILFVVISLSFLFSLTFIRFSREEVSVIGAFFMFFIFLIILFVTRLLFMKYVAYKNGFEMNLRITYFDKYWFNNYDRLSYSVNGNKNFKGIPMPFFSLLIYIISLGTLIFPSTWNYSMKKIPHRFMGTKQFYEDYYYIEISDYRCSKVLFSGFIFYFIFGFFMKAFSSFFDVSFYNWFTYTLFWIALFTIVPIIGTEGWELFDRNKFSWINALTILILGMLSLLVFESLVYVLLVSGIAFIMVFMVILWRKLM